MKIVKTNYKISDSNVATFGAIRGESQNDPNTQAIANILKKFQEAVSVADIVRPVQHNAALSISNIAAVSESVRL